MTFKRQSETLKTLNAKIRELTSAVTTEDVYKFYGEAEQYLRKLYFEILNGEKEND